MRTESTDLLDETVSALRKPLYLRCGPGLWVDLDGPALRIRRPARAVVLYPLARLARVVSSGAVAWDCEALLACAGAGIPVVFLRRNGAVRAYLFGSKARSADPYDPFYTRLRARLLQPGGITHYQIWYDNMICAAVRVLGVQLGQRLDSYAPHRLRQALAETRGRYIGPGPAALIEGWLRGLLAGLSAELLAEAGLDATRCLRLEFGFDLGADLAGLLGWSLEAPILTALATRFRGEPEAPDLIEETALIRLFEQHATDLRRLGLDALHQLRQWLET